jgi:hypothetical protein
MSPTEGRRLTARLYRDFDSLRGYQVDNVGNLRDRVIKAAGREGLR